MAACFVACGCLVMAFLNREIHNDEAWIGQQVWSLAENAKIESELFRDCPPLDREIIVYHKLLVWCGLAAVKVGGWGLYQLRGISFLSGLITLLLVFQYSRREAGLWFGWRMTAILLYTPVFWLQMLEFRPEALLLLCGFCSFFLLRLYLSGGRLWLAGLSGLVAGLAGLTHAFGLVFVIAGLFGLLAERRFRAASVFLMIGLLGFCPYVSGFFTDRALFIAQTIHNPLMTTSFDFHWWQPLVNLVTEHKRLLRKPEVIGLTIWLILALPFMKKGFWRTHRFTLTYLIVTTVVLAASPLPKFTRYMIPLVPIMAILIAQVWSNLDALASFRPKYFALAFRAWALVFFAYGGFALVSEALPRAQHQIEANEQLARHMNHGTLVMAPFDFVFMEQGNFTIQSWWGADRAADGRKSISFLENYADSLGVNYLIADPVALAAWDIEEPSVARTFDKYALSFAIPEQHRYLFTRVGHASPVR
jgi:4-amino-4-deoxy-L-arabinose transferase-like glycosyltransferase